MLRFLFVLSLLTQLACDRPSGSRFEQLDPTQTGLTFVNTIPENDTINILLYEYLYNGGGIGVGDFDRNGLSDLYFSGNLVSGALYLQQPDHTFRDVTLPAGLTTSVWVAGVAVTDLDGNGYEDLYLSVLDPDDDTPSPNLLFLNDGPRGSDSIPTFREVAQEVGLADPGYGTQAAFLDYDRDGDLDVYVLNNSLESYPRTVAKGTDTLGRGKSVDRLYENISPAGGDLAFRLTDQIRTEGWGLGVGVQDFNADGYPDLYVGNDFMSNDFLLINQQGQLRDEITRRMAHQSKNTMGVDIADLNNDGQSEIVTVDMLPDDNLRRKTMIGDIPFRQHGEEARGGYNTQYLRNTLQLNNGNGTFSDIALLAGTADTDWSWTPLLADFDNDGLRDLFVSNGYPKDITNRDFMDFSAQATQFGTEEIQLQRVKAALAEVDGVHKPNYLFRNRGDLTFERSGWLPADPTYSNGAVYLDYDLDGDLDLVTNNINEPAGLYRNLSREQQPDSTHFLQIQLEGPAGNPDGLGTRVYLRTDTLSLFTEQQRQRGYLSTLGSTLHFGLGRHTTIDWLLVIWPDGRTTERSNLPVDQVLTVSHATSVAPAAPPRVDAFFATSTEVLQPVEVPGLPVHRESDYTDFDRYALALRDNSHAGPALATDGRLLFFGGAAGQAVSIHDLRAGTQVQTLSETEAGEATRLLLVDIDGDTDLDLYVGNGSSEFVGREELLRDQLYINEAGNYRLAERALPDLSVVTGAVATADLEGDGDQDLFVGARLRPGDYPRGPMSYLLRNEGGSFTVADSLDLGMVTGAVWEDLNGDGQPDLAVVGEYTDLVVLLNEGGRLVRQPGDENLTGWWYSLTPNDLDGDGDTDLLAGNVGLNTYYRATVDRPLRVRADDYDRNGALDPIVTAYSGEMAYPVHPRNTLARQLPGLKRQIPDYASYGGWTERNLPPVGEGGVELAAREFRSVWLENDGSGRFTAHFLPTAGQVAPVQAAVPGTLADGRAGLLVVQNDYAMEVSGGRLDAGTGFALTLDGRGEPEVLPDYWSVRGDARSIVAVGDTVLVGINDGPVVPYLARPPTPPNQ
ncbi:VCBS repeat-containing protein [Neolewinella sp.]|uniref:VCBS repeat-containing protein n=1 Tax=Neolewinella sp. TaxID=2993543 RepID=UPI003B52BFC6